jgi:NAD(P)-dependent dehydrogenase (short-subunit alcohol dehydrogenase family)
VARTIAITGSASGIGAATRRRLEEAGHRVIGVDRVDAEVVADLATPVGRDEALRGIAERCDGALDGLVTCAGLAGLSDRPGSLLVAVNYFGTVALVAGARQLLAAGHESAVVALSSNSTTTQPGVPVALVDACLAGDEAAACTIGDAAGSIAAYPATKVAVARWIRRRSTEPAWAGAGIRLNAVAPGLTETAMTGEVRQDPVIGRFLDAFPVPIGRAGQPDDIAAAIAFLLGPDAAFAVGSVLFVDGGTDALVRPDDWPAPQQ